MSLIELESKSQYDALIASTPQVIVLAHAQYSAPSRQLKAAFASLAAQRAFEGKFAFAWFDAFDADDINGELVVRTFPACFLFRDGEAVKGTLSANATKEQLERGSRCLTTCADLEA